MLLRNSSPEKSSPEKTLDFLSQKSVLRPALQIINRIFKITLIFSKR